MKTIFLCFGITILMIGCQRIDKEEVGKEIYQTEKAFETMAAEKGIAEAFTFYADENAVIKRGNDSLIFGKEGISNYYSHRDLKKATVNWTPDYINFSKCGDLGYTYGKYIWRFINEKGDTIKYQGIFHTVWKKQPDGSWRYLWD
jgi:ketosteroid isomerase-like protein